MAYIMSVERLMYDQFTSWVHEFNIADISGCVPIETMWAKFRNNLHITKQLGQTIWACLKYFNILYFKMESLHQEDLI